MEQRNIEEKNSLQLGTFVLKQRVYLSLTIIFSVPRCECTDDSQCGAQGPGYYCDNCECKIKPGFEADVACAPDDFECSTRKSTLFLS